MFDNNKNEIDSGLALPLMESFYTIQGEGYFSGIPSYFLRIGGCDVGCHWCDVKESWDAWIILCFTFSILLSYILYYDKNKHY